MSSMVDLHCHILPGVDDGAVDLPDACERARAAIAQGCRQVFATSHLWEGLFDTSPELLRSEYERLVRGLEKEGIPLEVLPGAENSLSPRMSPAEFAEKAVPLGDGPWVLFDFSLRVCPPHVGEAIDALRAAGRVPLLAHPERNLQLQRDPTPLVDWIRRGARIQSNAASLLGLLGEDARVIGEHLLENGAVHVLASDAHSLRKRPFCLLDGRHAAARLVGDEVAERLAVERPWMIARGETFEVDAPDLQPRSGTRRLLRRFPGFGR